MARYNAFTLAMSVRQSDPIRRDTTPQIEQRKHAGPDMVRSIATGQMIPLTLRVSPNFTACPPRRIGRLARDWQETGRNAKAGRKDGWGEIIGGFDATTPKGAMVTKTEIRKPVVMSYTGKKASVNTDATAATMKATVVATYKSTNATIRSM